MSSYSEGQIHSLADQLQAAGFSPAEVTKLGEPSVLADFLLVLRGLAKVLLSKTFTIIRVDRKRKPEKYPGKMTRLLHPDLEQEGPSQFDLVLLQYFRIPRLEHWDTKITGVLAYEALKEHMLLPSCLGLLDLEAIQARGLSFFQRFYGGKRILGWKSVVEFEPGKFRVPYLYENEGLLALGWHSLNHPLPEEHYLTFQFSAMQEVMGEFERRLNQPTEELAQEVQDRARAFLKDTK